MTRQIALINTAHLLCHYCLLILPTAVLAMAAGALLLLGTNWSYDVGWTTDHAFALVYEV